MKKNPKNQAKTLQKKEDPATKKDEELGEGELNKVTGGAGKYGTVTLGMRKASGNETTGTF